MKKPSHSAAASRRALDAASAEPVSIACRPRAAALCPRSAPPPSPSPSPGAYTHTLFGLT